MKKYPRILFPILTLLLLAVSLTGCAAENGSGSGTGGSGSSASDSGNSASGSGTHSGSAPRRSAGASLSDGACAESVAAAMHAGAAGCDIFISGTWSVGFHVGTSCMDIPDGAGGHRFCMHLHACMLLLYTILHRLSSIHPPFW